MISDRYRNAAALRELLSRGLYQLTFFPPGAIEPESIKATLKPGLAPTLSVDDRAALSKLPDSVVAFWNVDTGRWTLRNCEHLLLIQEIEV